MSQATISYEPLPGLWWNLIHHVRLYQGPDHLLQVTTMWSQQTYKRFYFADIQAIQMLLTNRGKLWNLIWGAGALFCLFLGDALGGVPAQILTGVSLLCVVGLLWNALRGPTVLTYIRTAVQTERLYSLNRLRSARKLLRRLGPTVEAAQGSLSREQLLGLEEFPPAPGGSDLEKPPVIGTVPPPQAAPPSSEPTNP